MKSNQTNQTNTQKNETNHKSTQNRQNVWKSETLINHSKNKLPCFGKPEPDAYADEAMAIEGVRAGGYTQPAATSRIGRAIKQEAIRNQPHPAASEGPVNLAGTGQYRRLEQEVIRNQPHRKGHQTWRAQDNTGG